MKAYLYTYKRPIAIVLIVLCLVLAVFIFAYSTRAQTNPNSIWQDVPQSTMTALPGQRWVTPTSFRGLRLNQTALLNLLGQAPMEGATTGNQAILSIPMPTGSAVNFRIEQSPI